MKEKKEKIYVLVRVDQQERRLQFHEAMGPRGHSLDTSQLDKARHFNGRRELNMVLNRIKKRPDINGEYETCLITFDSYYQKYTFVGSDWNERYVTGMIGCDIAIFEEIIRFGRELYHQGQRLETIRTMVMDKYQVHVTMTMLKDAIEKEDYLWTV